MKIHQRHSVTIMMLVATSAALAAGVTRSRTTAPAAVAAAPVVLAQATAPVAQTPAAQAPAAPAAAPAAQGQTAKPQMAEDVFKNVRVLRGITVDDFMGTMGVMSAALSMCCDSCHDGAGTDAVQWDADTIPRKVTARRMVVMTQAINKANFGGRQVVTCWTCHRGRDFPSVTPDVELDVYGEPRLDTDDVFRESFAGEPAPTEILNKYIEAVGGAKRLATLTSITGTGAAQGFGGLGGAAVVRYYAQAPNRRATIVSFPKDPSNRADETRTFDGTTGWVSVPHAIVGLYQLSGGELDGARFDAQLAFPLQIAKALTDLKTGAPETINDRPMKVVQGMGQRGLIAKMFFDADNGLLVRVVRMAPSPIGRVPIQIDYSDYREVGGIRLPHTWTFAWLDGRTTMNLKDVRINEKIDPAVFGQPAPPKR